jgi:hypothetical protein
MNKREADYLAVNIMLEGLVQGYAEQFPNDDAHAVRHLLEDSIVPLFSDYGLELVRENLDQWIARAELSRAASGGGRV